MVIANDCFFGSGADAGGRHSSRSGHCQRPGLSLDWLPKPGESGQMRLAFEETTGQDMNWFWNQWYYGNGHPIVKIDYNYNDSNGKVMVIIEQTQKTDKIFRLPLAIDVYTGNTKKRYTVWTENKTDTFTFNYTQRPDLVNVDADKVMLWSKTDNKTAENFIFQYSHAPLYLDRREALDYFAKKGMKELARGLKDKYAPLRRSTIQKLGTSKFAGDAEVISTIEAMADSEKDKKTKAAAIDLLAKKADAKYLTVFRNNVEDSSYSVAGAALKGLTKLDPANAYTLAKKYSKDAKGELGETTGNIIMSNGTEADFDFIAERYNSGPISEAKFNATESFCTYLEKLNNLANVKRGIDLILKFRNLIPEQFRSFTDPVFKSSLDKLGKAKGSEITEYIDKGLK